MKKSCLISVLLALPLLTACASPREVCMKNALKDLRVVQNLISQTEATLDRGYAIETETRPVSYATFCVGTGVGKKGQFRICNKTEPRTYTKEVAVNLDDERRKLAALRRKEAELKTRSAQAQRQCIQTHPRRK